MGKMSTNVLVIGKSGVGKSSLLNYMFNKEIQKTGTGKPVTEKGIFPFDYSYDENFEICIYDTWGLEPDKAEEWKQLIEAEVEKHDKKNIKDWFNTIIFCLSANSDRVEDFEIQIIKSLIEMNNQILIAITHCKTMDDQRGENLKSQLVSLARIKRNQVVLVSNVEKKLIGKSVKRFGRQEVFTVIIKNLWDSLKQKVPYNIKVQMSSSFQSEKDTFHEKISKQSLLFQRDKKLTAFEDEVNDEFKSILEQELENMNTRFVQAMIYYNALSMKYAEIALINKETIISLPEMKYDALKEFKNDIEKQLQSIRDNVGDVFSLLSDDLTREWIKDFCLALKKYFSSSKEIKQSLNKTIDIYLENAEKTMNQQIEKVREQLQEIDVEQIGELMIQED